MRNMLTYSVVRRCRSLRCTSKGGTEQRRRRSGPSCHYEVESPDPLTEGLEGIWPSAASQNGKPMPRNIFRSSAAALTVVAMAVLTAGCGQPQGSSSAAVQPAATSSPSATPVVLPVPDGCPPAKELGQAWADSLDVLTASFDAKLLDSELSTPLPKNGCAYLYGQPKQSTNSSEQYQRIIVWYFNTNRPGRPSTADITAWAKSAGGTPHLTGADPLSNQPAHLDTAGHDFDLPQAFSGWTNSTVLQGGGDMGQFFTGQPVIPAFTQGSQAELELSVNADKAQAMVRASASGTSSATTANSDPTKALSLGLAAAFSTSTVVTNEEGYTAQLKVQGKLEPFVKDVTEAPPGKLKAVSSATVSGSITNTTAGRETWTPGASVMAVYPVDSVFCKVSDRVSVKSEDSDKPSYCGVKLGKVEQAQLAPDASQMLKGTTTPQKLGKFPESGDVIAQLNAPVSIYLYIAASPTSSTSSWHGDKGCLSQQPTGASWFVAMDGWPDVICK